MASSDECERLLHACFKLSERIAHIRSGEGRDFLRVQYDALKREYVSVHRRFAASPVCRSNFPVVCCQDMVNACRVHRSEGETFTVRRIASAWK